MLTLKGIGGAVAAATLSIFVLGATAQAAPLAQTNAPAQSSDVVKVGRGFGIYIGPGYGYRDYGYGYGGYRGYEVPQLLQRLRLLPAPRISRPLLRRWTPLQSPLGA